MIRRSLALIGGLGLAAALLVPAAAGGSTAAHSTPAASGPNLSKVHVKLQTYATGLESPVAIAFRPGDTADMFVAEQEGKLVRVRGGHVASTVLSVATSGGNEEGLLGVAFSKNGKNLFIDYTVPKGDVHVTEYTMQGNVAKSPRTLLVIPHESEPNHNGGNVVIGPDNMLYIAVGDGGGEGDPFHNGQNTDVLLAKILRINPNPSKGRPYTIPAGNPFAGKAGKRGEIWMYGLRNPWKFSFDSKTGAMWIGDVGQDKYEEIDLAGAGQKGINWGWNRREGFRSYNGGTQPPGGRNPLLERPHTAGDCAIIGGYVYRGTTIPPLEGAYVYGDFCTGIIRAVVQKNDRVTQSASLGLTVSSLTSFGQGPHGALFAASRNGTIYLIEHT